MSARLPGERGRFHFQHTGEVTHVALLALMLLEDLLGGEVVQAVWVSITSRNNLRRDRAPGGRRCRSGVVSLYVRDEMSETHSSTEVVCVAGVDFRGCWTSEANERTAKGATRCLATGALASRGLRLRSMAESAGVVCMDLSSAMSTSYAGQPACLQ
jgi:hypothetical protein